MENTFLQKRWIKEVLLTLPFAVMMIAVLWWHFETNEIQNNLPIEDVTYTSSTTESTHPEQRDTMSERKSISGSVIEIIEDNDSPNKWIGLLAKDSSGIDKEYKIFLSYDDGTNAKNIQLGEVVTIVYWGGDLSETEFVWGEVYK